MLHQGSLLRQVWVVGRVSADDPGQVSVLRLRVWLLRSSQRHFLCGAAFGVSVFWLEVTLAMKVARGPCDCVVPEHLCGIALFRPRLSRRVVGLQVRAGSGSQWGGRLI